MKLLTPALITPLLLSGRTALHGPRLSSMRMTTDGDVEIVDTADDRLRFSLADSGDLQLFMADELFCPLVRQITYEAEAGFVATDGVTPAEHGEFTLLPERRSSEAAQLKALSEQATSCEWRESENVFALPAKEVVLPSELEALLVDDTLKSQRPQVRLLWSKVQTLLPAPMRAPPVLLKAPARLFRLSDWYGEDFDVKKPINDELWVSPWAKAHYKLRQQEIEIEQCEYLLRSAVEAGSFDEADGLRTRVERLRSQHPITPREERLTEAPRQARPCC